MASLFNKKKSNNLALITFDCDWKITNEFINSLILFFKQRGLMIENYSYDDFKYKTYAGKVDQLEIKNSSELVSITLYNGAQSGKSDFKIDIFVKDKKSQSFGYLCIELLETKKLHLLQSITEVKSLGFKIDYGFLFKGEINKYSLGYVLGVKQKIGLWGVSTEISDSKWREHNKKILEGFLRDVYLVNILNLQQIRFKLTEGLTLEALIKSDNKFGTLEDINSVFLWSIKESNLEWVKSKIIKYKIII